MTGCLTRNARSRVVRWRSARIDVLSDTSVTCDQRLRSTGVAPSLLDGLAGDAESAGDLGSRVPDVTQAYESGVGAPVHFVGPLTPSMRIRRIKGQGGVLAGLYRAVVVVLLRFSRSGCWSSVLYVGDYRLGSARC
jgi:hypothetical protein